MKMEWRDLRTPEDQRDATTSQGTPAATRNRKRQRTDSFLKSLGEHCPAGHGLHATDTDFGLWPPELRDNKFLLFQTPQFVVLRSHSHRKLIYSTSSLLASESSAHSLLSSQKESFSKFCLLP